MTTPTNEIIDQIPNFLEGDAGFNKILAAASQENDDFQVDPDLAKSALVATKPIYQKADAAHDTAQKAMRAVEEIEKKQPEREAKAEASTKEREAAQDFDAVNAAFSKVAGSGVTLTELFSAEGYENLGKKLIDGLDFDITYDQVIASTLSNKQYDKTAAIMKKMLDILKPDAAAGKTITPQTGGGGAAKPAVSGYQQELQQISRVYGNAFDFKSVQARQNAIKEVKSKYGVAS
jgi:hypothetical protein